MIFSRTTGFSAKFKAEFWIEEVRYQNPLIELAMATTQDGFKALKWGYWTDRKKGEITGQAESVKESKLDTFFRTKVNPFLLPSDYSFAMAYTWDYISWQFSEKGERVVASVKFCIRKTTFFNKPEQERLSMIIQRLFEQVAHSAAADGLGIRFTRDDSETHG
jgi:hypothetical protein